MAKIISRKVDRTKQILSEKTGRGKEEATQIAGEYKDLERMTDSTAAILEHLQGKLKEMLQPNPNIRLKMDMSNSFQKMKGQVSANKYPQAERGIADVMMKGAQDLGDDSYFSKSLFQVAETFQILSDAKDDLDLSVRQRYLDPIAAVVNKDIKEISHHRKKVTGRRLDYDAKRKKHLKGTVTEQELSLSADRFEESFDLAEKGMRTLLDNDLEQVQQVLELTRSFADYHKRASEALQSCLEELEDVATAAKTKPPLPRVPRTSLLQSVASIRVDSDDDEPGFMASVGNEYKVDSPPSSSSSPCCKALYDFDSETDQELSFREGDTIMLINQLDDNWYEGSLNGKSGIFPVAYVQVLVPI